ncbi:hypothetical protein BABINDRAFT_162601 [Babjeviella inositovora NRRL Y-12698]|uniref:Guanine nucleotide-binding protein subunit alpha n=1 Tax=Babjeviella inositovora NRRL Y-12698 TaxID=984486 RepID=A0A1E3QL30_9ASCO|nr:uncharacterized protein BABINDRAFT_162601 [Babjeviella inositovora NRRL Y-12698]ODQ78360.1 hypothetical protein BABINDRAFT_162601 [Babjeviella inositovora NRRL Y-12698]
MGCGISTIEDELDPFIAIKRNNDAIEKGILLSQRGEKNAVKLLLLGAGESGKSTVLKQMKLLHQGGFTHQERLQYAQVIWVDAIQAMKILIVQARKMRIPLECDQQTSPLFMCKQIVLRSRALEQIDTGAAGGSSFLNDYVVRYSQRSEAKRRTMSTGRAGAMWENQVDSKDTELDVNEIGQGLRDSYVQKIEDENNNRSRKAIAAAIQQLWKYDPGIAECYSRSNEFQLEGSTNYYFEKIESFADSKYLCTDEDILKGRIKTTGITETNFNIGSSKFKILDTGGQRSERRKWIHCFEDITAVIFVLAISEYDQMLFEDENVNRMHESIMLFNSLCNSRWFINTPFILFLNKTDIFEKKILTSSLRNYFPDYKGKPKDTEEAIRYLEKIFLSLNRLRKPIYVHRTCATDTQSMRFVLTAVTDMIMQQSLKQSGII